MASMGALPLALVQQLCGIEFKKFITSPTLQKPIAFTFAQEKLVIVVLLTHNYNSRLPPSYVPDLAGLPCAPRGTNNGPRAHSRVNQTSPPREARGR